MSNIHEFTVSEISRSLKIIVEDNFGYVRIKGEVSGFKKATSGHLYFNLKDENSTINAVCFKGAASKISFDPEDGMEVVASGKVTIYEGRSNYQIIIEKLEMAGIGAILAAIEKRRIKLLEEGYFDEKYKKTLPYLPKKIGVITSSTGAVIEDIINRINARFPTHLLLYPVAVQGKNSASEIISAIKYFNQSTDKPELIIVARGGGSIEDLLSFNDELLVKTVFNSKIPIISAVGHETDTTLIDYVSDVRAATPSAAAEIAVPVLKDLQNLCSNLNKRLETYLRNSFLDKEENLKNLSSKLIHPNDKLADLGHNCEQLFEKLKRNFHQNLQIKEQELKLLTSHIQKPSNKYEILQNKIIFLQKNLESHSQNILKNNQNKIQSLGSLLISYDYKNVLARGYAVVRSKKEIINSKNKAEKNQKISIEVVDGEFSAIICDSELISKKTLPKNKFSQKKEIDKNQHPLLF
ncbi:MAG: exodeoxyribonuclease VII large subunit [Rickettsiales bacterium]|jgi:exodeoxyribonuclease VII large subunit